VENRKRLVYVFSPNLIDLLCGRRISPIGITAVSRSRENARNALNQRHLGNGHVSLLRRVNPHGVVWVRRSGNYHPTPTAVS
jgi:hypothetical protein